MESNDSPEILDWGRHQTSLVSLSGVQTGNVTESESYISRQTCCFTLQAIFITPTTTTPPNIGVLILIVSCLQLFQKNDQLHSFSLVGGEGWRGVVTVLVSK